VSGEIDKWNRYGTMVVRNRHPANENFHVAREYLDAARTLHNHPMPITDMIWLEEVPESQKVRQLHFPLFYCIAHACELFLKAFLGAKGLGPKTPGWRRHDIKSLLAACIDQGLTITEDTRRLLDDIASENSDFTFRFPERLTPIFFPPAKGAIAAVEQLDQSVEPAIAPFLLVKQSEVDGI
jgi:hypothetical protein